jgi:predicted MFS family arabinose efflux permease
MNTKQSISPALKIQITLFTLVRTSFSTANRMVYPFLSHFARGLGVTIGDMSLALTARSLMGVLSPFFSSLADRYNKRLGMLIGTALFTVGNGLVWIWPIFPVFVAALSISFLGVFIFVASTQAYMGDEVAYEQRGSMMAIVEFNWSLAFIAGVPLVGLLIAAKGWLAPFPLLTILGIVSLVAIIRIVPGGSKNENQTIGLKQNIGIIVHSKSAMAALAMAMAVTTGNEIVNLMFGVWLEDSYQLQIAALGAASIVIGCAEMLGEGVTAFVVDKVGKKRTVAITLILNMVVALIMPWIAHSVTGALIGLFLFYLSFETMIVSSLPIMTEILPSARATLMGLSVAAFSLGRAIGAAVAPLLYTFGFRANTMATFAMNLIAFYMLTRIQVSDKKAVTLPEDSSQQQKDELS